MRNTGFLSRWCLRNLIGGKNMKFKECKGDSPAIRQGMIRGAAAGVILGAATGIAMGNTAFGVAIGLALGAALGMLVVQFKNG